MTANSSKLSAADQALNSLLRLLESGQHPPGSRLPAERELCVQCGVSRKTLRRALARLTEMDRVESRHGSGTFVTQPPAASLRSEIAIMYTTEDAALDNVVRHAESLGCTVRLYWQPDARWQPTAEQRFLRAVRNQRVRGLLAFCTPIEPHSDALLRDLETCGVRVLHIEHYRVEPPEQAYLLPDFRRAAHMALVRLMIAGYRHLYFVGSSTGKSPFEMLMRQGFADALHEHRPNLDPAACHIEFPQIARDVRDLPEHQQRLEQILRALPPESGLLLDNVGHASGLLAAAERVGSSIPEQCGMIGIDVAGGGRAERPPAVVDTLAFDRPALLDRALRSLLADEWNPPQELVMPAWIHRETVRQR